MARYAADRRLIENSSLFSLPNDRDCISAFTTSHSGSILSPIWWISQAKIITLLCKIAAAGPVFFAEARPPLSEASVDVAPSGLVNGQLTYDLPANLPAARVGLHAGGNI